MRTIEGDGDTISGIHTPALRLLHFPCLSISPPHGFYFFRESAVIVTSFWNRVGPMGMFSARPTMFVLRGNYPETTHFDFFAEIRPTEPYFPMRRRFCGVGIPLLRQIITHSVVYLEGDLYLVRQIRLSPSLFSLEHGHSAILSYSTVSLTLTNLFRLQF